jgi:WD40 repeat protein
MTSRREFLRSVGWSAAATVVSSCSPKKEGCATSIRYENDVPGQRIPLGSAAEKIAWSPDGKMMACLSHFGTRVSVFHEDGDMMGSIKNLGLNLGSSLVVMNDGNVIVPSTNTDGWPLRVRNILSGASIHDFSDGGHVFTLSPNCRWLAVSCFGPRSDIVVYDTESWRESRRVTPHTWISSLAFLADSKRIAAGSINGQVYVINDDGGCDLLLSPFALMTADQGAKAAIDSLAIGPDGESIAAAAGLYRLGGKSGSGPFDTQGTMAWIRDNKSIRIIAPSKNTELDGPACRVDTPIRNLAWHHVSDTLLASGRDNDIQMWRRSESHRWTALSSVRIEFRSPGFAVSENKVGWATYDGVVISKFSDFVGQ